MGTGVAGKQIDELKLASPRVPAALLYGTAVETGPFYTHSLRSIEIRPSKQPHLRTVVCTSAESLSELGREYV
jgi:hypothetical protein